MICWIEKNMQLMLKEQSYSSNRLKGISYIKSYDSLNHLNKLYN